MGNKNNSNNLIKFVLPSVKVSDESYTSEQLEDLDPNKLTTIQIKPENGFYIQMTRKEALDFVTQVGEQLKKELGVSDE